MAGTKNISTAFMDLHRQSLVTINPQLVRCLHYYDHLGEHGPIIGCEIVFDANHSVFVAADRETVESTLFNASSE